MHELSVALSLVDLVVVEAGKHGATQVERIHMQLGPLSGVVKEALLSAFDIARATSPITAMAELRIEETALRVYCPVCEDAQTLASPQCLCCPRCGTPTPKVVGGQELDVVSLEVNGER